MSEETPAVQEQPQEVQANTKEFNFAQLRRQNDELKGRLEQQEQMLHAMKAQAAPPPATAPQDPYAAYGLERGGIVESDKFVQVLEKERERNRQEADKISRQTYKQLDQERYGEKLRMRFPDYEKVMATENTEMLIQKDPRFAESLSLIPDEYKRRELAYQRIKELAAQEEQKPKVTAQQLVDKNKSAAFHYAPGGIEHTGDQMDLNAFVNDPQAKKKAYERLKAAQKRGIR